MKKIFITILMFFQLTTITFSENDSGFFTEVTIIDILTPTYYSGINPTFYTIIAHRDNQIDIFYFLCFLTFSEGKIDEIDFEHVRKLDIEKGKKYIFSYHQRYIDGYTYNNFKLQQIANLLYWYFPIVSTN